MHAMNRDNSNPVRRKAPDRSRSFDSSAPAALLRDIRRGGRRVRRNSAGNGSDPTTSSSSINPFAASPRRLAGMTLGNTTSSINSSTDDYYDDSDDSGRQETSYGLDRYFQSQSNKSRSSSEDETPRGRRGVYKQDSERRLKQALAKVGDLLSSDDNDSDQLQQQLKDRFSASAGSSGKRRMVRRASMGSVDSSSQSSISLAITADNSIDILDTASASTNTHTTQNDMSSALLMMHASSMTLPMANVVKNESDLKLKHNMKTDQIIESIVWFSFHTPRTVLEDLITHELDLWRRRKAKRRKNLRTKKQQLQQLPEDDTTNDDDDFYYNNNEDHTEGLEDDHSDSSMSDDGMDVLMEGGNLSENLIKLKERPQGNQFMTLPKSAERESALLFVDMSGFTRLSTMLDVESLSKVINAYFDMIVAEVIHHGGDILKFAGDAFFAEWRVADDGSEDDMHQDQNKKNPLAELNASLVSVSDMGWDDDEDIPKISTCALMASRCAMAIVAKYSDYHVTSAASTNKSEAMLNVHCGVGVGHLSGLHVGDFKEDQEEDAVELRREFLILGEPIEQVSVAADVATSGEVYASPEAMLALAHCVEMTDEQRIANGPVLIASRNEKYIQLDSPIIEGLPQALQPYESLRMHCKALNHTALARLHLQMALYVHPVIRGDELALSAAIQAGKISQPTATLESRHRAEAELRSVFTLFIKAIISSRVAGMNEVDTELYKTLGDIMHVTSRELDRYSGHLRQFIVDDKGVVLIATFGLRGATFPNMVANNALPATFAIHRALKNELNVENRIGATFGKAYCGVVGGLRRHEFAVMGASVNLAARLMASKVNKGILVDEAVGQQAGNRFSFKNLPPVQAKGYDRPVPILEPLGAVNSNKLKKRSYPLTGRREEKLMITSVADEMLEDPAQSQSSMIFLMGESGVGKSALVASVVEEIRKSHRGNHEKEISMILAARSTSNETQQRIPLSSFRQVFLSLIRDHCEYDGTFPKDDESYASRSIESTGSYFGGLTIRSMKSLSRRGKLSGMSNRQLSSGLSSWQTSGQSVATAGSEGTNATGATPIATAAVSAESAHTPTGQQELDSPRRSMLTRSRGLHDFSETSGTTDTENTISQSFRTLTKHKYGKGMNQSFHNMNASSSSLHGGPSPYSHTRTPRPGGSESLSHSLHQLKAVGGGGDLRSSLAKATSTRSAFRSPNKGSSVRKFGNRGLSSRSAFGEKSVRDDSSAASFDASTHRQVASVPYFEKLCWICEQLDYPFEYADIVGSQFLGLESANPVTHIEGHVPTMDELVEYLALAFICITEFADLSIVVLDDFQWVDAFSWKIFRVLCKRGKKMMLICATRSHDKQAMRRMSSALTNENQLQNQMTEISLGPLDFSEIGELISLILDVDSSAISDGLCTDIFQRTGGLPVFVVQVLENIRRKKTLELVNGQLKWTAEGLKEKKSLSSVNNAAVMEETFLSRFDALDVRVRKVLQTCAVLGLRFALTDVIQVHPEISESDIENALDTAVDEMILVEHVHDDDDATSLRSGSVETDDDTHYNSASRGSSDNRGLDDRFFQFSHAMWRNNVLTTMLKERKIELHKLIAESMERDQVLVLEQSDISRLLTLFDHWKSCGDFCKSAPLALAVGARLEEWDLSAQSLELYEDALELSFDSVFNSNDGGDGDGEWVQVKARPMVLDLILRLHICIGLCHQRLGDPHESTLFFEDAFNIIKSASKVPGMSKSLMMPIISSLCVLKLEQESGSSDLAQEQEKLLRQFVDEARENGHPVHICRAYSIEASRYARLGNFGEAVSCAMEIQQLYDVEQHGPDMIAEYGSDFALAAIAESVHWLYLSEKPKQAEDQADHIIAELLPLLDPAEVDDTMLAVLPLIQVLMLVDRAKDADWLLKNYIINPYHDSGQVSFWSPLFNPLAYVLELVLMEEADQYDPEILDELEAWVLDENSSMYDIELERKAHTLMGELCWRLAYNKEDGDEGRERLLEKARDLLVPVARYPHGEIFLKHTARALLEAL